MGRDPDPEPHLAPLAACPGCAEYWYSRYAVPGPLGWIEGYCLRCGFEAREPTPIG